MNIDKRQAAVQAAKAKYESAAQAYANTVSAAFPKGTVVTAKIGGHVLRIRVGGVSGGWWSEPGKMYGVNVMTGKMRVFYASDVIGLVEEQPHE